MAFDDVKKTPATTTPVVSKWSYPFKDKAGKEVTDPTVYFEALAKAEDGFYPVGTNGQRHGGIHFGMLTADALLQDKGVRCIADGEVIAYRIDSAYPRVKFGCGFAGYSRGFVLVKHCLQLPPAPKTVASSAATGKTATSPNTQTADTGKAQAANDKTQTPAGSAASTTDGSSSEPSLTFFSLYMHLLKWGGYEADTKLARPGFWGKPNQYIVNTHAVDPDPYTKPTPPDRGINVRQSKGGAQIGWLPAGTQLTVAAGSGTWRKIASIDSGQMLPDPTNTAKADAPLGWVYTSELDAAPSEPKSKDAVLVLDTPVAIKAGDLVGYLGEYERYVDTSALACKQRPLAHVEVLTGDDVTGFIAKSKARGATLPVSQKTLLVVDKGSKLVLPATSDATVAAGTDAKATADSPSAGQWVKVQVLSSTPAATKADLKAVKLTPTGDALWIERAQLGSNGQRASTLTQISAWSQFPLQAANATGPQANYLRVAATHTLDTMATDDKGVRWWKIDVDVPDAKGNLLGWACETAHLQSPWQWPGFAVIDEDATAPVELHAKHILDQKGQTQTEQSDFEGKSDQAKQGQLFQALYDVIDTSDDGRLSTDELRVALRTPWQAQTLSRLIARFESEWSGPMAKWDALDAQMGDEVGDWLIEKSRMEDLQWWDDLKGKQGFPDSPVVYHFHPIGLIANFREGKKSCEEKFQAVSPIILFNEGGFVNDPDDAGGATNKGIAWGTWQSYAKQDLGLEPTLDNLKNLTSAQAEVIYRKRYWEPRGFCNIENEKTGLMIYDWTITSGKAIREVQEVLVNNFAKSIKINNAMGKTTIDAINEIDDQELLVSKIAESRKSYYTALTYNSDGTQNANKKFLVGWLNRVDRCLRMSI